MPNELIQIGRIKGLSTRIRLGSATKSEIQRALDIAESKSKNICNELDHPVKVFGCRIGSLAAIGILRDELTPDLNGVKISGLGIIVGPQEDCEKGFEKIIVTSPLNKEVHICRLAPGYRKKTAPEGKPAYEGPLRRLKRFGPGIEHNEILPIREYKIRKAEKKLTQ